MLVYINLPAECFNPPSRKMKRCTEPAAQHWADLKICTCTSQTWPQSWTPSTKLSSTAEHKPLPPRKWIQMSWVSVSPIYMLCIFTTGKIIGMLASSDENVGGICFGHTMEKKSSSGVRHLPDFQRTCQSYFGGTYWMILENILWWGDFRKI